MEVKSFLFKRYILILILVSAVFIIKNVNAQITQPMEWHTFWGAATNQPMDHGKAIAYYNENIYIAGFTSGAWDVDPAIIMRDYTSHRDGYVAKMTPEGDIIWLTYLGSQWDDECLGIEVTPSGIYVCGYSGGVWPDEAAMGSKIKRGHYVNNGNDAFVAKLNFDGTINWLSFLGGAPIDIGTDISVDEASGFVYATGYSTGSWISDSYQNNEINPISPGGREDAFAIKLETDGDYLWHTFMGGTNGNNQDDKGHGIDFDGSGNVYVGGSSTGSWGIPLTGFDHNGGAWDGFIAKLNPSGTRLWHLFMGTTSTIVKDDECFDVEVESNGNIYATGYTWGDWDTEWGTPIVSYPGNQQEDIFVTKINTDGAPQWYTVLGGPGGNQGHDIDLRPNGDLYISGIDGDCWGNPTLPAVSGADAFAMKLDNDGNLLWRTMMGGYVTDIALGIAVDESESVFVTGHSILNWLCVDLPLHPHTGNPDPFGFGSGHTDIFVARLNPFNSVFVPEHLQISVVEGETAAQVVTLHDICDKVLYVSASLGTMTDNGDDTYDWSYNTTGVSPGIYEVTINGDDGNCWTPSAVVELEVLPANHPPVFTIDHDPIYVNKGETATNIIFASDPDGDDLFVNTEPIGSLSNNGDGTWTWSVETSELPLGRQEPNITVWADDGQGGIVYKNFDLIVKNDEQRMGDGLEWLEGQQDDSGGDDDGSWNGQSDCFVQNDAPVTTTALSLVEYCGYAYENSFSPFETSYEYNTQVTKGFDFLFSRAQSDGQGGIYFTDPHPFENNYATAAVLMAIGSSRMASYQVDYPSNPVVNGKTFKQLMEEIVLYLQNSQETNGSWNNDNYVVGNVAYALIYAEKFGVEIAPNLKDKLSNWIDYIQDGVSWGGVRFDPANPGFGEPSMLNTAHILVEMALVGDDIYSERVIHAYDFLADHWCNPQGDQMWIDNYVELIFTIMKAFKLYSFETVIGCEYDIDWYTSLVNHVYMSAQNYNEGWWQCAWGVSSELATVNALLTMGGDIPLPPVDNEPPKIICPADIEVEANDGCSYSGEIGVPEVTDDHDVEVEITNDAPDLFHVGEPITVTWTATDSEGESNTCTQKVTVTDKTPPEISCPDDLTTAVNLDCSYNGDIGSVVVSDNCTETAGITITNNAPLTFTTGKTSVIWSAEDIAGNTSTCSQVIIITNTAPVINSVKPDVALIPVNSDVMLTIEYADEENDITSAKIDWGDGDITEISQLTHLYDSVGVFTVTVSIKDACELEDKFYYEYIVVFDPSAGFVTGGGWIESPPYAYKPDPDLSGKANFGFVSKYKKGKTTPDGNTEFKFHAADLNFHSSLYDWLVIAGAKAMFKGEGTINNLGWYGFQLSAIDADLTPSTDVDLFRIQIWDKNDGDKIVYDNILGDEDPNADPNTEIAGGSIVIHVPKKKSALISPVDDPQDKRLEVTVYPNPTKGNVAIEIENYVLPIADVVITNVAGQKVFEHTCGLPGPIKLDLSDKITGLYLIYLDVDGQQFVRKINLMLD